MAYQWQNEAAAGVESSEVNSEIGRFCCTSGTKPMPQTAHSRQPDAQKQAFSRPGMRLDADRG